MPFRQKIKDLRKEFSKGREDVSRAGSPIAPPLDAPPSAPPTSLVPAPSKSVSNSSISAPTASMTTSDRILEDPETTSRKRIALSWGTFILTGLRNIAEATEILAPLKAACGVTSTILEAIQSIERNKEAWKEVHDTIVRHKTTFEEQLKRLEAADMGPDLDSPLMGPIKIYGCTLELVLAAILRETGLSVEDVPNSIKKLKELVRQIGTTQLEAERIAQYPNSLNEAIQHFMISLTLYMAVGVQDVGEKLNVISASFTAQSTRTEVSPHGNQHTECLPGTRSHILHPIEEWAGDVQPKTRIYCIGDAAGTGKSTIANHMAQKWDDEGRLAARFFFSKGNSGTSTASDLCIFIARDLAFTFPSIRASIRSLLEDTEALSAYSVRKQWKKLVSEPLSQLNCPLFMVIDAIDECSLSSRGDLLYCIRETFGDRAVPPPKIKILLTTRLEKDIDSALRPDSSVRIVGILSSPSSQQQNLGDVERFIKHRSDQINTEERQPAQRLSEDDIDRLIIRSRGLFIFAATACTSLAISLGRKELLKAILAPITRSPLDDLYTEVLRRAVPEDSVSLLPFKTLLGVILAVKNPLSIMELEDLLERVGVSIPVERIVRQLASVLSRSTLNDPVYILHPTFREFLLQNSRSAKYTVNIHNGHHSLALSCLDILLRDLTGDICQIRSPRGRIPLNSEINDLKGRLSALDGVLRYAAEYWVAHAVWLLHKEDICSRILEFFQRKVLNWVEYAGLSGRVYQFMQQIRDLQHAGEKNITLPECPLSPVTLQWCIEVLKFIQANQNILRTCTMDIYSSALVFLSSDSLMFCNYHPLYADSLPKLVGGDVSLSSPTSILHVGKAHGYSCVSVSPDGGYMTTNSETEVFLWDIKLGAMVSTISCRAMCITFSRDGGTLITAVEGGLHRWNGRNGNSLGPPWTGAREVSHMVFSADGQQIACIGKGDLVYQLNAISGDIVAQYSGGIGAHYSGYISDWWGHHNICFSTAGDVITAHACGNVVLLQRFAAGYQDPPHVLISLKQSSNIHRVAFHPSGHRLATTAWDQWGVWNTETGEPIFTSSSVDIIDSILYFDDGKQIVTSSILQSVVHFWSAETGESTRIIKMTSQIQAIAYFMKDNFIVTKSNDDEIVVRWLKDSPRGPEVPEDGRDVGVRASGDCFAFSHDGKSLASFTYQKFSIWDVFKGCLTVGPVAIQMQCESAAYHPSGEYIASGSRGDICLWSTTTGEQLGKQLPSPQRRSLRSEARYCVDYLAFSPDGRFLAAIIFGGGYYELAIWEMENGSIPTATFKTSTDAGPGKSTDERSVDHKFDITSTFAFDRTSNFIIHLHEAKRTNARKDSIVFDGQAYWVRDVECNSPQSVTQPKIDAIVADTFPSPLVKCRKDAAGAWIDVNERSFAIPPNFNAHRYAVHDAIVALVSYDHQFMIIDCANLLNRDFK